MRDAAPGAPLDVLRDGAWIRVPGSTSNLGPGFDTLGMAVDRYLSVEVRPAPAVPRDASPGDTLTVERSGTLAGFHPARPADDLLLGPLLRSGTPASGLHLRVHSEIPVGRGLGSSAAARVAGEVLVELLGTGGVDREGVLARATRGEGHPDNVVPSVFGGLLASGLRTDGSVDVRPLSLSPAIGWGFVAPSTEVPTARARDVLPDAWDRATVVRGLSRLARLVGALGDPEPDGELLGELLQDELHVPHRLRLIPGGDAAVAAGLGAGAWAVTISGAGSGLLVAAAPDRLATILSEMRTVLEGEGEPPVVAFPLRIPPQGVRFGAGPLPHAFGPD